MLFEGISDIPDDLKKEIQDGVRGLYDHNPSVACVAITAEETRKLAAEFCKRLACAVAPTVICIPMRGWGGCDIASPDLELGWAGEGPGPRYSSISLLLIVILPVPGTRYTLAIDFFLLPVP